MTLAAGCSVALFLFGQPQLRFDASLPRYEFLTLFARLLEPRVERNNAAPQTFEVKVRAAGLFHQQSDLGQHALACRPGARTILIEHSEPRVGRIPFGGEAAGSLAQIRGVRARRGLRRLRGRNLLTDASKLGLQAQPFVVAFLGFGIAALVLALQLSRLEDLLVQASRCGAPGFELGLRTLDLVGKGRGLRAQADELRFRACLPLARCVALSNGSVGTSLSSSQGLLGLVESQPHVRQRFAKTRSQKSPRKDRALAREAPAGNRTASGDLLAAQRYDRVSHAPLPDEFDARLEPIDDQNVTDQEVDDARIARRRLQQRVRIAENSGHGGQPRFEISALAIGEGVERQKSRAAGLFTIEKFDAPFGIFRGRRDDVGKPGAESNVHRASVPLLRRDQIRNDVLDPAQLAALPRFDDCARSGNVPLERVFQLFAGVQARLRGCDVASLVAMRAQRRRDFLLRGRRLKFRILSATARIEQFFFERCDLAAALPVTVRCPTRGNLELLCALASGLLLSLEALDFGATSLRLNSPLRLAGRLLRRAGFDLAQLGENLFQLRARL